MGSTRKTFFEDVNTSILLQRKMNIYEISWRSKMTSVEGAPRTTQHVVKTCIDVSQTFLENSWKPPCRSDRKSYLRRGFKKPAGKQNS